KAAEALGITAVHIPFASGQLSPVQVDAFKSHLESGKRIHAYCRTGKRSQEIWQASRREALPAPEHFPSNSENRYQVVIVGAGSGGIAVAASLLKRRPNLRIALVDPAQEHFYQPGWTMVGGGVFKAESTRRTTARLIPKRTRWIQQAVTRF